MSPLPAATTTRSLASRVALELVDAGLLDHELAADRGEVLHPARELHPLVDRHRDAVEPGGPVDRLRAGDLGMRDRERDPLDRRARVVPEVDPERALVVERRREHALARHHPAVVDLLGRAVRDDRHVVAVLQQADAELQPGLAAADDRDRRHQVVSSISLGMAGTEPSGPIAE